MARTVSKLMRNPQERIPYSSESHFGRSLALNSLHPLAKYVKSLWPCIEGIGQVHDVGPNAQHRTSPSALSWGFCVSGIVPVTPPGISLISTAGGQNLLIGDHATFDGDNDYTWFFWFRPGISDSGGATLLSKQGAGSDSFVLQWAANENWTWDVRSGTVAAVVTISPALGTNSLNQWCLVVGQHDSVNNLAVFTIVDAKGRVNHGTAVMDGAGNTTDHNVSWGNVNSSGFRMLGCLNGKVLSPNDIVQDLWNDPFGLLAPAAPRRRVGRSIAAPARNPSDPNVGFLMVPEPGVSAY